MVIFFAFGGAKTELPQFGISIPQIAFFYAAPVVISGLYIYLHLYLVSLWNTLADAPANIGGFPLSERIPPSIPQVS